MTPSPLPLRMERSKSSRAFSDWQSTCSTIETWPGSCRASNVRCRSSVGQSAWTSKTKYLTGDQSAVMDRTILTASLNFPRPTNSSPSSGRAGSPALNHAGAWKMLPPRERKCSPSQMARTPSSFSDIHQPSGRMVLSQFFASIGGFVVRLGAIAFIVPHLPV